MLKVVRLDERTRFDRDAVFNAIDTRLLTPPTRKKVRELKRKNLLTVPDQCYLMSIRDYLRLSDVKRKRISSRPLAGFTSRLNQKERELEDRKSR